MPTALEVSTSEGCGFKILSHADNPSRNDYLRLIEFLELRVKHMKDDETISTMAGENT